jgi:hypothetical protein
VSGVSHGLELKTVKVRLPLAADPCDLITPLLFRCSAGSLHNPKSLRRLLIGGGRQEGVARL